MSTARSDSNQARYRARFFLFSLVMASGSLVILALFVRNRDHVVTVKQSPSMNTNGAIGPTSSSSRKEPIGSGNTDLGSETLEQPKADGVISTGDRDSGRRLRHLGKRKCNLSEKETRQFMIHLSSSMPKAELLSALTTLYGTQHLGKELSDFLLSLFDGSNDSEVRDAVLEVLLYAQDESYIVEQIASKLGTGTISDHTYAILSAYPASKEMLAYLIRRFEVVPIESTAGAEAVNKLFWEVANRRKGPDAERLGRMIETRLPGTADESARGTMLYTLIALGTPTMPEFVERWWTKESSFVTKRRILDSMSEVASSRTEWAKAFLRKLLQQGIDPELATVARDSLRRLSPEERDK